MVDGALKSLTKRCQWFLILANELKVSDKTLDSPLELPLINGDKEMLAAIIF